MNLINIKRNKKILIIVLVICILVLLTQIENIRNIVQSLTAPEIIELSREEILQATTEEYPGNTVLLWDEFRQGENDSFEGAIPANLLDDPVYCSMNLPSESRSDTMIDAWRDNGHITGFIDSSASNVLSIGAIYTTSGITVTDDISVCIGKIKLFAFSDSNKRWEVIDDVPYPNGIYLYKMPWGSSDPVVEPSNIQYNDDYVKITLTPDEINGYCLHFWGIPQEIKDDYLYYACAYEFWVDDPDYSGNDLTATIGIDAKDADNIKTTAQLFSSRGLTVSTTKKIAWGHTIPSDDYDRKRDGDELVSLFNK